MLFIMTIDKSSEIHIGEIIVKCGDCKKLLGVKIDSKLHFSWLGKKLTGNCEH